MISFILFIILLFGFLMGLKRGLILQLFHLLGYIIAFIVAKMYFKDFAIYLDEWIPYPKLSEGQVWAVFLDSMPLEVAFYNAIAFIAIFFITKVILQIIVSMLDFVAKLPVLRLANKVGGAVLGFVEVYLIMFILLYIVALLPIGKVQSLFASSKLAEAIVTHTPILSKSVETMWFTEYFSQIF